MNVRIVDVGRVGVCMLCVCDSEQRECGVGPGVNSSILSETLWVVGLTEVVQFIIADKAKARGEYIKGVSV